MCAWGRTVVFPENQELCDERDRVAPVLVLQSGGVEVSVPLCARHAERLPLYVTAGATADA